jgi:S-adenosylmethionine synthetase
MILLELAVLRRENKEIKYLRPDAKSQVTLEYNDNGKPVSDRRYRCIDTA